jgi:glycerol-3-phosphate dehydrogenase
MNRDYMLRRLDGTTWDFIVIGGGATGLGIAVDAQTRGFNTLLLEQCDFAKATSSRSTKLVHGGVRYLKQGNVGLVVESLRERGLMCLNAPHLVQDLAFVVPRYRWWEGPFYGIGFKLYDRLAGKLKISRSRQLNRQETIDRIPNIQTENLIGGAMYHDAQFDDARMAATLALTAADHGAAVINYMRVTELLKDEGTVSGVRAVDQETGLSFDIPARVVVNATGIFADAIRRSDDPTAEQTVSTSQGVHIVLDRSFQPSDTAIMVPRTDDGRVLFVIPWHERVLVGTTDTPMTEATMEPRALPEEIGFILRNAARYLEKDPSEADVLSVFAGLRPLVQPDTSGKDTKSISREHSVLISDSGLITIIGGKWTTYRKMAQDTVDDAIPLGGFPDRPCVTERLRLHGWMSRDDPALPRETHLRGYGSEAGRLRTFLSEDAARTRALHPHLPYLEGQVTWAARYEMARTVDDVLARRTRCLFLDARAAIESAPRVAELLAVELERDADWARKQVEEFDTLARGYLP